MNNCKTGYDWEKREYYAKIEINNQILICFAITKDMAKRKLVETTTPYKNI